MDKGQDCIPEVESDRYPAYPPKPEDMVAQYAGDNIFPYTAIDDKGKVIGTDSYFIDGEEWTEKEMEIKKML